MGEVIRTVLSAVDPNVVFGVVMAIVFVLLFALVLRLKEVNWTGEKRSFKIVPRGTNGAAGGCAQQSPILVRTSNGVEVVGNTAVGPWPRVTTVDGASTRVTNRENIRR